MRNSFILYAAALVFAGAGFQSPSLAQTKVTASDVVINGESFFEMSNITSELTRLARADGYIGANESFRQIAKSGYSISQILGLYTACNPKPKYLISDGGGIDFLMGSCPSPITVDCQLMKTCKSTLQSYLAEMKKSGTKKVLWMIYPDPMKNYATTLKPLQDVWAQIVPPVINACTDPKTLLVDLRPVWSGHTDYTTDGIHCTDKGGTATATAFWKAIKDNNFFDAAVPVQSSSMIKTAPSVFLGQAVSRNTLSLSLSLVQPSNVSVRITTLSGRTVLAAVKQEQGHGLRNVQFPLGAVGSGMYCLEVQAGQLTNQSALLVP
jgi:hypothetical protein